MFKMEGANVGAEVANSFVTKNRSRLILLKSYPTAGQAGVTLYPQVRLWFDAPPVHTSAQTEIRYP